MQLLGWSIGAMSLDVILSPRPLTLSIFVGYIRLPSSLILFFASFSSGWKVIVTMKSSLPDSFYVCVAFFISPLLPLIL